MSKSTFEEELKERGVLVYTNVGTSMRPLIRQGKDVMIISSLDHFDRDLRKMDVPLYKRENGQYVLHRIIKVTKDGYVIRGDNTYSNEYGVTDSQILGVLSGVIRNGKEISVNSFGYKVYSYLWLYTYYIRKVVVWVRRKNRLSKSTLQYLKDVTGNKKLYFLILMIVQILQGISGVCFALLLKSVIDSAVIHDGRLLIQNILLFMGLIVLQMIFSALLRYYNELSKATFENNCKARLFEQLLHRDYSSISSIHSAEWMNRLTSDTVVVSSGLTEIVPGLAGMAAKMLGALSMIILMEPRFVFVIGVGGILMVLLTTIFRKKLKAYHKIVQEKDGKVRIFLQEHLHSLMIIKVFTTEKHTYNESLKTMEEHKQARMEKTRFSNVCNVGFSFMMNGAYVLGAIYSVIGIYRGTVSYGTLMALLQLISQIQAPFANITSYIPKYHAMIASSERLLEIEKSCMDIEENNGIKDFDSISLEHIDFSYEKSREVILKDFNFHLEKGECIGFTGPSGCGKSTVLKVLLSLYPITSGTKTILCDGKSELLTSGYRHLFSYVPQGNQLMSGTIRDVVTFSNGNSEEKIWEALEIACASDFVRKLPDGLDTQLKEQGSGISEGQMQRLAIARAIYSNRPILLLDEATSALDVKTEKQVLSNLKAMKNMTVIIVTHRLEALSICSREVQFKVKEDE